MISDSLMRRLLWIATAFNFGGAFSFAFPASPIGKLIELPLPVPGIYCALLAFLVALFGAFYAWLALQPIILRPFVAFAALGKAGVFGIVAIFWLAGNAPLLGVVAAGGDLIFAVLFALWLWKPSNALEASQRPVQ